MIDKLKLHIMKDKIEKPGSTWAPVGILKGAGGYWYKFQPVQKAVKCSVVSETVVW
jgi:hypothetical protein